MHTPYPHTHTPTSRILFTPPQFPLSVLWQYIYIYIYIYIPQQYIFCINQQFDWIKKMQIHWMLPNIVVQLFTNEETVHMLCCGLEIFGHWCSSSFLIDNLSKSETHWVLQDGYISSWIIICKCSNFVRASGCRYVALKQQIFLLQLWASHCVKNYTDIKGAWFKFLWLLKTSRFWYQKKAYIFLTALEYVLLGRYWWKLMTLYIHPNGLIDLAEIWNWCLWSDYTYRKAQSFIWKVGPCTVKAIWLTFHVESLCKIATHTYIN